MRTRRPAMAACVALALTACGAPSADNTTPASSAATHAERGHMVRSAEPTPTFGDKYTFGSGLVVSVSAPRTFHPSDTAYPRTERAIAFEVSVHNDAEQPYRLSGLAIRVLADGREAKQVVDAPQGFNGIVDAGTDVPPGRTVRLNLAFAVPPRADQLRMVVRPDTSNPATATYTGPV